MERRELSDKAYIDILTGLDNRTRVMDEFEMYKEEEYDEFTIINFDLNDLKKINDTDGHLAGDRYLCVFSEIIKENLKGEFHVVGRTGGDEFIAITDAYFKDDYLEKVCKKISSDLDKRCKNQFCIQATFAYGFACSSKKTPIDIGSAYKVADKMMYECKRRQKVSR